MHPETAFPPIPLAPRHLHQVAPLGTPGANTSGMKTNTKLSIAALVLMFAVGQVSAMTSDGVTEKPGWFHRTFGTLSWNEVIESADSPKDVCAWVKRHVKESDEPDDKWRSGADVWERGHGNCKNFAAAVADLCRDKGFDATILVVGPRDDSMAHAIVVGQWNGKMWMSDNGRFEIVDSMDDVKHKISKDLGWRNRDLFVQKYVWGWPNGIKA